MAHIARRSTSEQTDFASLMPDVAALLLDKPNERLSNPAKGRLRFGTHGSMEIDIGEGWFDDHEANVRGGVLELIQHKRGCNMHGALTWLEEHGLKERQTGNLPPTVGIPAGKVFYDYRDASGAVAYRVERRGKDAAPPFLQHGPDGRGGFRSARGCMQGVALLPYRLPELLAADPSAIVFVCEGEKDADRLARDGLIATTNSGGAGKFSADLAPHFAGRRVVALADNDEAGEKHALDVESKLRGIAAEVAVLRLPDLPPKGDVSDWLRSRGAFNNSVADLVALAEAALANPAGEDEPTLEVADLAVWSRTSATPTRFFVPGFIPAGEVTLLTGAGGGNKSTFGQQLATCAASGRQILGLDVMQAGALYVTAEDNDDRLHWMQEHICKALGVSMTELAGRLFLASIRGRLNNALATFSPDGKMLVQDTFNLIRATLLKTGAKLIVLDNVAHLFAGNENDRGQVTAFVNLLYALCRDLGVTVLLIAHVNKDFLKGNQQGNATSGSTAWLNAVRSQLLIQRAEGHDPDARVLTVGKSNYARPDQTLAFRWNDFALIRDEDLPADRRAEMAAVVEATAGNAAFMQCLASATEQQRAVSHNPGSNYAPKVFARMPEGKAWNEKQFAAAMERLLHLGSIKLDQPLWRGPNRVMKQGIKAAENCTDPPAHTPCTDPHETRGNPARFNPPIPTVIEGAARGSAAPSHSDAPEEPAAWQSNPALGRTRDLSRTVFPLPETGEPAEVDAPQWGKCDSATTDDDIEWSIGWGGDDE